MTSHVAAGWREGAGEELEGVRVAAWLDTEETEAACQVDRRTLSNWRKLGLPSRRDPDGRRWYALPHLVAWQLCLIAWSHGGRVRVDRVPFAAAWARLRYEYARRESGCGEAGLA